MRWAGRPPACNPLLAHPSRAQHPCCEPCCPVGCPAPPCRPPLAPHRAAQPLAFTLTLLCLSCAVQDAGVKMDEKSKAIKVDEYSHTNVSLPGSPCLAVAAARHAGAARPLAAGVLHTGGHARPGVPAWHRECRRPCLPTPPQPAAALLHPPPSRRHLSPPLLACSCRPSGPSEGFPSLLPYRCTRLHPAAAPCLPLARRCRPSGPSATAPTA